jgi:hypothetical protein
MAKTTASTTATSNVTVLRSRAPLPRSPPQPWRRHTRSEKHFISGAVVFLAILLAAGILYVGLKDDTSASTEATLRTVPLPRMARILLPGPGSMCREVTFDNDTGIFSNDRLRPCDEKTAASAGTPGGSSGLSSFREGFSKRP